MTAVNRPRDLPEKFKFPGRLLFQLLNKKYLRLPQCDGVPELAGGQRTRKCVYLSLSRWHSIEAMNNLEKTQGNAARLGWRLAVPATLPVAISEGDSPRRLPGDGATGTASTALAATAGPLPVRKARRMGLSAVTAPSGACFEPRWAFRRGCDDGEALPTASPRSWAFGSAWTGFFTVHATRGARAPARTDSVAPSVRPCFSPFFFPSSRSTRTARPTSAMITKVEPNTPTTIARVPVVVEEAAPSATTVVGVALPRSAAAGLSNPPPIATLKPTTLVPRAALKFAARTLLSCKDSVGEVAAAASTADVAPGAGGAEEAGKRSSREASKVSCQAGCGRGVAAAAARPPNEAALATGGPAGTGRGAMLTTKTEARVRLGARRGA